MKKLYVIILCVVLAVSTALLRDNVAETNPADTEYLSALTVLFSIFGYSAIILVIRTVRKTIYGR